MTTDIQAQYERLAQSDDPETRKLAQRQLTRLQPATTRPPGQTPGPGHWAHVPLADLFAAQGNALHTRANGAVDTGHEPLHRSSSGRCVSIDPTRGLWYCRSCRRGGDAITFVRQLHGWRYHHAAVWLREHYGPSGRQETV